MKELTDAFRVCLNVLTNYFVSVMSKVGMTVSYEVHILWKVAIVS